MRICVLIVTYKRSALLRNCLAALARQRRAADQVVVAGVRGDVESRQVTEASAAAYGLPCVWLEAESPSVVAQTNLGVAACDGDIVVFTNDDAEAHPDWLERIEPYYADASIGGVGGRDFIYQPGGSILHGTADRVGQFSWFGRLHGNHHLSYPEVTDVQFLKGVNMSCRRELYIPLDKRLAGGGRWHWELDLCMGITTAGRRLVFDPGIAVDHHHEASERPDVTNPRFIYETNYNLTLCLAKHWRAGRRVVFLLYDFLWGDYPEMGWAVFLRTYLGRALRGHGRGFGRLLEVSLRGKLDALAALRGG